MLYILYKNSGVHSGRALRKKLSQLRSGSVRGGFPKHYRQVSRRANRIDHIINLGVTDDLALNGVVLNSQDMIRASSNKRRARITFRDTEIPAPRLFLQSQRLSQDDLPVVARTSYHKKGQGFWFCQNRQELQRAVREGATHFLEFIPNTREYRVHTFIKSRYLEIPREERKPEHYVSIKISEKIWTGVGQPDPSEPQKNHGHGWTFLGAKDRRKEEMDVVRHAAKQAIAVLGMDFGAVDVMYRIRNKRPYVLEVNSTPSLSDANSDTCERYAQRILRTIGEIKEQDEDA